MLARDADDPIQTLLARKSADAEDARAGAGRPPTPGLQGPGAPGAEESGVDPPAADEDPFKSPPAEFRRHRRGRRVGRGAAVVEAALGRAGQESKRRPTVRPGVRQEVRLVVGRDGDPEAARHPSPAPAQGRWRREVDDAGVEIAEPAMHARRHRGDGQVRVDARADAADPHHLEPVVLLDPVARSEEDCLVPPLAQMGGEGHDRPGDTVDPRQEALGDDRHAHPRTWSPAAGEDAANSRFTFGEGF